MEGKNLTINIHQVGFLPLYLPFYIAVSRAAEKLGWNLIYHLGVSDEDNIKRACRFKFQEKDSLHIVLTALHNLKAVKEENKDKENTLCKDCPHKENKEDEEDKCKGIDDYMDWYFPWVFVVKLPVYVFLKGKVNQDPKSWQDIMNLLEENEIKKIYIYPEGSTIYDVVLNHIFEKKIEKNKIVNINFNKESEEKEKKIDDDKDNLLVFTLNPSLYEKDGEYKLVMKAPHHFFPFTGIAFPVIRDQGIATEEMKFIYYLEEEYINFMTSLQESVSPFLKSKRKENHNEEQGIPKDLEQESKNKIYYYYVYEKKGEYEIKNDKKEFKFKEYIEASFDSFINLYNSGVFREHTENVIVDYLRETTYTTVTLFDPEIYKVRVKDATAYVFGRNLSHVYGSNVIPYVVEELKELEKQEKDNLKRFFEFLQEQDLKSFFEFLQERMDYIATIISGDNISPYAFIGVNIKDILELDFYNHEPFLYLYKSASSKEKLFLNIEKENKDFMVGVPPILYSQAFYSIFENILRNSAKYGKYNNELNFKIKIENEGNLIKITIIDKNVEKNELKNTVEDLNRKLKKVIVDPYLNINYEWFGLKEVKISCAYLRGIPLERIDLEKVISVEENEDGIGFVFYLYPFEHLKVVNIDELKNTKNSSPSEFIVVKGQPKNESVLKERKYTRIFIEEENYKGKNWENYVKDWLNMLKETEKEVEVKEYFASGESDYKEIYKEIKDNYKDKIIVAYVRHLKDIVGKEKFYGFLEEIKKVSPYSYIQSFKGGDFIYNLVQKASKDEFIKYKLIESALLRVLILDERVQEKAKSYKEIEEIELKSLNIYVPKTPLISAVEKNEDFKELCGELEDINKNYKPHIVVVHVSLLEIADKNLGEGKFKEEILDKILKDSDIILTTGRGRITSKYRDNYGDGIPVSHILKVFEKDYINKYLLSNILIGFNRNLVLNLL